MRRARETLKAPGLVHLAADWTARQAARGSDLLWTGNDKLRLGDFLSIALNYDTSNVAAVVGILPDHLQLHILQC